MSKANVKKGKYANGDLFLALRRGEKGTGAEVTRTRYWDNPKSEDAAWNHIYAAAEREGLSLPGWDEEK